MQDTFTQTNLQLSPSEQKKSKILIVEDDMAMAKALEIKLNKSGFSATSVANGQEALNLLRTDPHDLVLLDIMMPVMDGWSFLEQLSNSEIKTKVIVTSNLSQEEDVVKAKSLGAIDFLIKSNESLVDIVSEVQRVLGE